MHVMGTTNVCLRDVNESQDAATSHIGGQLSKIRAT